MSVKLGGRLPDEENAGLYMLQEQLVRRPEDRHVLIAVIDCGAQNVKFGDGGREIVPTGRLLYVEPIRDDEDINDAVRILGTARSTRLGREELDFEEFGVGDPFESLARTVIDAAHEFADEQEQKKQEQADGE